MAITLESNQGVFASTAFTAGSISGNPGEPTRLLTPGSSVFPDDSVIVVSFSPDGTSIVRFDVFASQTAYDNATSLDDASETYFDMNNNAADAANGIGPALHTQADHEGDSFIASSQPDNFRVDGTGAGLFAGVTGGSLLIFAPNIDLLAEGPTAVPVDLDGDGNEEFDSNNIVCFLTGTMIAIPGGEVAIEALKIGDLVLTVDGTARPVRWLARQTASTVFADPLKVMPVIVRAGALGDNLPVRDLYVSADHALKIDGMLAQAGALVNGTTIIRQTDTPEILVYYHIELEDHALVLAEGVPAETYVDNVARRRFDNYAEYVALYGDAGPAIPELDLPRVKSARQLAPATRARLAARAEALGLAPSVAA